MWIATERTQGIGGGGGAQTDARIHDGKFNEQFQLTS